MSDWEGGQGWGPLWSLSAEVLVLVRVDRYGPFPLDRIRDRMLGQGGLDRLLYVSPFVPWPDRSVVTTHGEGKWSVEDRRVVRDEGRRSSR